MTATTFADPPERSMPSESQPVRVVEYIAAGLVTIAAVIMHLRYFLLTGGLWRDEVTSLNLSNSPSLSYVLSHLYLDSFPAEWLLTLRVWQRIGIGTSDWGVRLLGLLTGLGIVALLWRNARRMGARTPIVSLTLLTFTSAVICYGDSIRAYGLGMLLALPAMGCIFELTQKFSALTVTAAAVCSFLSVHMLFYNSVLLAAVAVGALVVFNRRRHWQGMVAVLGIGLVCAVSLLVYRPMILATRGYHMFQVPLTLGELIYQARRSVQFLADGDVAPGHGATIWGAAVLAGVLVFLLRRRMPGWAGLSQRQQDAALFAAAALFSGILGYAAFLKILHYRLEPWYFLAAMALVASCLDGLLGVIRSWGRISLAALALALTVYAAPSVWANVGTRRTNVDLIARQLEGLATAGDVIVAAPWEQGVTLRQYYHGPAEVISIPPVPTLHFQQYTLILPFLRDAHAMEPLVEKLIGVLKDGHRIWIVGDHEIPAEKPKGRLPTEPDPISGWDIPGHQRAWTGDVFYRVGQHAKSVTLFPDPTQQPVSHYEQSRLTEIQGYLEAPPATRP
jgi:hypothetical protein